MHYEPDFDYTCPHCRTGFYNDVGMGPFNCLHCGKPLSQPTPLSTPGPHDDALDDPRFLQFDEYKAFKFLRKKGWLRPFLKGEP